MEYGPIPDAPEESEEEAQVFDDAEEDDYSEGSAILEEDLVTEDAEEGDIDSAGDWYYGSDY